MTEEAAYLLAERTAIMEDSGVPDAAAKAVADQARQNVKQEKLFLVG